MSHPEGCDFLCRIDELKDKDLACWLAFGLVCELVVDEKRTISKTQYDRLRRLAISALRRPEASYNAVGLFTPQNSIELGQIGVSSSTVERPDEKVNLDVLAQLLPKWQEQTNEIHRSESLEYVALGKLDIVEASPNLANRIRLAQDRITSLLASRVSQFSRSAHYMGSKASLAPYLNEILHTYLPKETVIVDLMCGSGAAAGIFSKSWRTFASDAQQFSRLLATVQGGGMNQDRASEIGQLVLRDARVHYESLPVFIREQIHKEEGYLASELTLEVMESLSSWISKYPRIGNELAASSEFSSMVTQRQVDPDIAPYVLFSTYYANLFFGVRQSAEIDSLRYAIDKLSEPLEREWALGALIAAVSHCAYTYGGHFAQPKLDPSNLSKISEHAKEMLVQRGLSVSHEFMVRLTSLGAESARTPNAVETVEGPWELAVDEIAKKVKNRPICVYFDPPYTRDEYSRYYHVLETLVRYGYPAVDGKPSIPSPNMGGRFASPFSTRSTEKVEVMLARVIDECVSRGWTCLWSYSSTGVASVGSVIEKLQSSVEEIELFGMNHVYKAQGRHKAKPVLEYAAYIRPKR